MTCRTIKRSLVSLTGGSNTTGTASPEEFEQFFNANWKNGNQIREMLFSGSLPFEFIDELLLLADRAIADLSPIILRQIRITSFEIQHFRVRSGKKRSLRLVPQEPLHFSGLINRVPEENFRRFGRQRPFWRCAHGNLDIEQEWRFLLGK